MQDVCNFICLCVRLYPTLQWTQCPPDGYLLTLTLCRHLLIDFHAISGVFYLMKWAFKWYFYF